MDNFELKALTREDNLVATTRKIREDGYVPGILYGNKIPSQLIQIKESELEKHFKKHGTISIFNLKLGRKIIPVKINEIQKDRIIDKLIHFDLQSIEVNKKVEIEVPIHLVGESKGVKNGGTMNQQIWSIRISSFLSAIPETIDIDISELDIGDSLFVRDIIVSEDIEITHDSDVLVLTVLAPRVETVEEEEVVKQAPIEPEVIGENE